MANVIDWLNANATYLASDRPDLYSSVADALSELCLVLETVREGTGDYQTAIFGPYVMLRFINDDVEEIFLTKKLSSLILFGEEEVCRAYGWVKEIVLDDPLDDDLDP